MQNIPMLKKKTLEEMITLRLDKQLHTELVNLKAVHGVDYPEWIRSLIRNELPKLKKQISA